MATRIHTALPNVVVDITENYAHVLQEIDGGRVTSLEDSPLGIVEEYVKLIERLAVKHPNFQFIYKYAGSSVAYSGTGVCDVFQGTAYIGFINYFCVYIPSGATYRYRLDSLSVPTNKGYVETASLSKATSLFKRYFKPVDTRERAEKAIEPIKSKVSGTKETKKQGFANTCFAMLSDGAFTRALHDQIDEVCKLIGFPADSIIITEFKSTYDARAEAEAVSYAMDAGGGWLVSIDGDVWGVKRSGKDGKLEMYSKDSAPADVRRGVSILRMTKAGTFRPYTGMKVSETQFFVMENPGGRNE